jgi:predicted aldo/keto reductase-like oxidoreductase
MKTKIERPLMRASNSLSRREFILASLGTLTFGEFILNSQQQHPSGIPRRALGKTGEQVSIIGIGGWDIGNVKDRKEAIAIMHEAIDEGVNFLDNCWDYHNGGSEDVMGEALSSGGRRDKVFLMTKVCARDYRGALAQLEQSLKRLRTDHIDLWQFHGIKWEDDPELIFDPDNGALKAALEAKKAGKIRFIGFTGHKDPKFHLAMLKKPFQWDTVQMPLNILDEHYASFRHNVLTECVKRNIGVIAMKSLAAQNGIIVRKLGISADLARRYALSLPISVLVCGIQSRENLRQDIAIARNFKPLSKTELKLLADKAAEPAKDGKLEAYKVGNYGCDWHHNQKRG